MKNNDLIKLTLINDLQYLDLALTFVRKAAELAGFSKKDISKIELASEEAISNVIEHAYEGERDTFELICERIPVGIKFRIKDKGIPFDPEKYQKHNQKPVDLESIPNGLGLHLIKESMDEVHFNNLGMEGKEIQLIKYLSSRNIKQYLDKAELAKDKKQEEISVIKEKLKYSVRRMLPDEAIEVSRCAYKSHGYSFFDDHIYYPERIAKLNETDDMVSGIATTEDGKFMGHCALVYPSPDAKIAEMTYAFVNPEYREQSCGVKIADYILKCPKKKPLSGIYGNAVTNHEYSQRGFAKLGINDCGLLLATSPQTWTFKGISGDISQRMSTAFSFKYVEETPTLTIYTPPKHKEMIKKLYANICAPQHVFADINSSALNLPAKKSKILTEVLTMENCAKLAIVSYGADVLSEVKIIVRELCLKNIAAIQLLLNLEDPFTYSFSAEFEKMNFLFAGILPISPIGYDGMILQYLNNVDIDYDKIVLFTPMAKELREYIKKCDPNILT